MSYIYLTKNIHELFCMKGISFKINIYYSRKKWAEHSIMICLALYFIFGLYCLCQYVCYVRTICPTARCRIASKELPHHPPPPPLLFNSVLLLLSIITLQFLHVQRCKNYISRHVKTTLPGKYILQQKIAGKKFLPATYYF